MLDPNGHIPGTLRLLTVQLLMICEKQLLKPNKFNLRSWKFLRILYKISRDYWIKLIQKQLLYKIYFIETDFGQRPSSVNEN